MSDLISRQAAIEALTGWQTDPTDEEITRTLNNLPPADRPTGECRTCKRCSDYCCETDDDFTRCPIEEHYRLPKDGYCHLYEQI